MRSKFMRIRVLAVRFFFLLSTTRTGVGEPASISTGHAEVELALFLHERTSGSSQNARWASLPPEAQTVASAFAATPLSLCTAVSHRMWREPRAGAHDTAATPRHVCCQLLQCNCALRVRTVSLPTSAHEQLWMNWFPVADRSSLGCIEDLWRKEEGRCWK